MNFALGQAGPVEVAARCAAARVRWRHPLYLIHSLTNRCNATCGFCAWSSYDTSDELSAREIRHLYEDARRAGFFAVSIWGGEPLVHRDIGPLLRHARAIGLHTHMVTNGALLKKKMDNVVPHLDGLTISVDHPSERHDELRGIPGLYGRILDSARIIRERWPKTRLVFVYTLLKGNADPQTLETMAEVSAELGVKTVFNGLRLEPAAEGEEAAIAKYALTQEETSEAFAAIRRLKERGLPITNSFRHLDMMRAGPPVYRCHWPKVFLPVEANGDVVDCMHWGTRPVGNVRKRPFAELLRHPRLLALAGPTGEACHQCVSIHRVEVSEIWEGSLPTLRSWMQTL